MTNRASAVAIAFVAAALTLTLTLTLGLVARQELPEGQGRNETLWEHQGEAAITWGYDTPEMHCEVKR